MTVREKISPNVTKIIQMFNNSKGIGIYDQEQASATLHPNGIVEIYCPLRSGEYIREIYNSFNEQDVYPVSVTGLKDVQEGSQVGSKRFCTWNRNLAESFDNVINQLNLFEIVDSPYNRYFVGTSKYFRFMKYESGGEHFPHYDSDFFVDDTAVGGSQRTKYTLVAYFSNNETGEIAFCNDSRDNHRNSDWDRQATEDEIYLKIKPRVGKIVIFPHTLCHTVLPFTSEFDQRVIVRGDLIFGSN